MELSGQYLNEMNDLEISDEYLEWDKRMKQIRSAVWRWEVKPETHTEDGFVRWIDRRDDIRSEILEWLQQQNMNKACPKDNTKANNFKEQGNEAFRAKNYPTSVELYTQSARYADKQVFPIAVANRSASFFNMCRYKESLQDIDLALECGYPEALCWKLHLRAAQCYLKLRQGKLAKEHLRRLTETVEKNKKELNRMTDVILKQAQRLSHEASVSQQKYESIPEKPTPQLRPEDILPKNETYPFASSLVTRKRSSRRGRYVVATKDIKKGDLLFVEKAFAWVPVYHGNNVVLCDHCCGNLHDVIFPCRGCVEAKYCSSTCWKESWPYHQWECQGEYIWKQIGAMHLAIKVFWVSLVCSDKMWFNDVQKLVTNVEKHSIDHLFSSSIAAMMVTSYMDGYTNFFDVVDLEASHRDKFIEPGLSFDFDLSTKSGKKLYFESMILRHTLQVLSNAYAIHRFVESEGKGHFILSERHMRIAAATYPSSSMLNHSCDPSVKHSFWKNWIFIKACKDIAEGEEIFHCYGPYYRRNPKASRQMHLKYEYSFDCECSACMDPKFDNYVERFGALKCQKCSGPALRSPGNPVQSCLDCGETRAITCDDVLKRADEFRDKGFNFCDHVRWEDAIPFFEKSLAIREKYVHRDNEDLAIILDSLGIAYASTGDYLKSISCLERSLAAWEQRYGSDSIEVAKEIEKITDVCMQYVRRTIRRRTQEYRETFAKTIALVDRGLKMMRLNESPFSEAVRELEEKKELLRGISEELHLWP